MRLNAKLRPYASLIRVPYILVVDGLCALMILTFQSGLYNLSNLVLAILSVSLVVAGSSAINDYFDLESDQISHPERAIPSMEISPTRVVQFSAVTFVAALVTASMINILAFAVVALNVALFVVYPRVVKRISGFLSNLVMGYLGATVALFSGAVVFDTINVASLSFVAMIAAGAIALNVLKDVLTFNGDLKAGYDTLAIKRGIRTAVIVGALFLIVSTATSPLPYLVGAVGAAYLIAAALWGGTALFMAVSLFKTPNAANVKQKLKIFNASFPYVVGAACLVYALLFAIGELH
jgi:4-hydroxybenzoate polyprenyltransferase